MVTVAACASHFICVIQTKQSKLTIKPLFQHTLADFVKKLATGIIPSELQVLARAYLTGQCLHALIKEDANCYCFPLQCVCAPGGVEALRSGPSLETGHGRVLSHPRARFQWLQNCLHACF